MGVAACPALAGFISLKQTGWGTGNVVVVTVDVVLVAEAPAELVATP
jgi:hypothetical protein